MGVAFLADGTGQWLNEPKIVETQRILFFSNLISVVPSPMPDAFIQFS